MPLYEYQCAQCGAFEVIRKFSDDPLTTCPTCGGPVEKLLSAPAIQFKGTGWYITDYARKGGGEGKGGESKSGEGKSEGKDAGKSDKPAASSTPAAASGSTGSSGSSSGSGGSSS